MNDLESTIDTILRSVFDALLEPARGVKFRRIQQVERLLREYLDTVGEATLCPCNRTLLSGERQWEPDGAFCRIMGADELFVALPFFVRQRAPLVDPLLRRMLAQCVDTLVGVLVGDRLVSADGRSDVLRDIRDALDDVLWELNRAARDKRRAARRARAEAETAKYRALVEAAVTRQRPVEEQPRE
ncbi:hypothetical protein [Planctomonas psychrotolerans]|uniref:hypothetical protein n=1 Tax=Planctomonas psychrotolerans TaxID=2528712 RepID=UPI001239F09A|nr:hypothetical protein [Planctomonas psychrotolerans]